jgi:hypothetical protein
MIERSAEAEAFFTAIDVTAPELVFRAGNPEVFVC